MERYDVVIVGGGPAGSTAAYYCDGLRVLIVDKCDFPRNKACGGGLVSCRDWAREFGNYAEIEKELQRKAAQSVDTMHIYWNEKHRIGSWQFRHVFDQVDRAFFDHALLQQSLTKDNVSFRRFCVVTIRWVVENGIKWYILSDGTEEIRTRFVVGADGMLSRVSAFLRNVPRLTHQYGTCIEYDIVCEKNTNEAVFNSCYGNEVGYAWIFPTRTGYYVGLGAALLPRVPLKKLLDRYLAWAIASQYVPEKHTIKKTYGSVIPLRVVRHYCSDGVLLCGDAMGTVNVAVGEGIYFAMKSGKVAGQTIAHSTENLRARYKKAMRPIVRQIYPPLYVFHKGAALTFFHGIFMMMQFFEKIGIGRFLMYFFTRRIFHRGGKDSYYRQERIKSCS